MSSPKLEEFLSALCSLGATLRSPSPAFPGGFGSSHITPWRIHSPSAPLWAREDGGGEPVACAGAVVAFGCPSFGLSSYDCEPPVSMCGTCPEELSVYCESGMASGHSTERE